MAARRGVSKFQGKQQQQKWVGAPPPPPPPPLTNLKRLTPCQSSMSARPAGAGKLTEQERALFGNRCPRGYKKLDLLGKGGCAVVWLGQNEETGEKVAMKQFPRGSGKGSTAMLMASKVDLGSYRTEVAIGEHLFASGRFAGHPGLGHAARFVGAVQEARDCWLLHEVGGRPLSKQLFELKGEFYNSERLYHVHAQPFYLALKADVRLLQDLLRRLLQLLGLLAEAGIVHADLKSENVLLEWGAAGGVERVQVIDFGSGFLSAQLTSLAQTTPEYMAPEALRMLELKKAHAAEAQIAELQAAVRPWSLDMWSLGAIFLEILTGFPLWLGLKGRTVSGRRSIQSTGVFAAPGREPAKILAKQRAFLANLERSLKKYDCFGLDQHPAALDLLARMLDLSPARRISPADALRHPFLASC